VNENQWSGKIIGACIEAHKTLGPGLLENVYQQCLAQEFSLQEIPYKKEIPKPINYKGVSLDCDLRLDFLVNNKVVVELKPVAKLLPVYK
jgi:GxxExxY protein